MSILRIGILTILAAGVLAAMPVRSAQAQTITAQTLVSPSSVAPGATETIFATAFADAAVPGSLIVLRVMNGNTIVATQTWTANFTAYQLVTEVYSWTAPTGAPGTYTASVQIVDFKGVTTVPPASFTVTGTAAPVNGSCGAAAGIAVTAAPTANLCSAGSATAVSGNGPWTWTCLGANGGTNSGTCTAPLQTQAVNGACGSADGTGVTVAPSSGLCAAGTASGVSGNGPWSWSCAGSNGGTNASCTAPLLTNGACGPAAGVAATAAPSSGLCSVGTASAVTGNGPWEWSCAGSGGGNAAVCTAPLQSQGVNGACGSANGVAVSSAPAANLCAAGNATGVSGTGPWAWSCLGTNGGTNASCAAPVQAQGGSGVCGASNGQTLTAAPVSGLCSAGTASAVTGSGPWSWSCAGTNGGATAQCAAQKAGGNGVVTGTCGSANGTTAAVKPTTNLCAGGNASVVTGNGPWMWVCLGSGGGANAVCRANAGAANGACGSANGSHTGTAPATNLCSVGVASVVSGTGPWDWTCTGLNGGTTASCAAEPMTVTGACGSANGHDVSAQPAGTGLCSAGTAESLSATGTGWTWICAGSFGGTDSGTCAATLVVNGSCGAANGTPMTGAPGIGLCSTGTATAVSGNGPWTWSCAGAGGGTTANCRAPVEGECGAADGTTVSAAPSGANLCLFGTASGVSGTGPWTWSCTGAGTGGTVANCEALSTTGSGGTPGTCGSANGVAAASAPTTNLCASGSATSVTAIGTGGTGPWVWTCLGSNGGTSQDCRAPLQGSGKNDGQCGPANGTTGTTQPAQGQLCSAGTASAVTQLGNDFLWSCLGSNGGATADCSSGPAAAAGKCGSANGQTLSSAPSGQAALCAAGTPSAVTGLGNGGGGPWTWSCSGTNGGLAAGCYANATASTGVCGSANGTTRNTPPSGSELCSAGTPEPNPPLGGSTGPWTWACVGNSGGVGCSANTLIGSGSGRQYLNGVFHGWTSPDVPTAMGYSWDYSISGSYQDFCAGCGASWMTTFEPGYPEIVAAYSVVNGATDFGAAASGSYNHYYQQTAQWFKQYENYIYAVRVDHEFNGDWYPWSILGPSSGSHYATPIAPATWIAGFRNLVAVLRQYLPNAKIIWNPNIGYNTPDVFSYYPGDDVVDLIGPDAYCPKGSTEPGCWNNILSGAGGNNLAAYASFSAQHNKPIVIPEWGDGIGDGYYVTQMGKWINSNNVVAHSFWDDDVCCQTLTLDESAANKAAYIAAFGNRPYTGTYWPKILPPGSPTGP